ncbi:hypothetical protein EJ04DRAFT_577436 [Polyplosphaeria fusca]|uniref:DH domain-containing protein n=1 Tax=Polyplosphaeria fusca TaxID=682080 RepID=A0A9P4QTZ1_9PLEO|nr:hypothetical protein EJ04DRAFT_577436 [Polyplosphaeria fusca]
MAEPEHHGVHNFAYHPTVANWVHSTSLAQLDGADNEPLDDPDAFYRPTAALPPGDPEPAACSSDMTTTRQRQNTPNGAARTTPKAAMRSVSGPASSSLSTTRPTPHLPGNRPRVKDLAQKFNQPSSTESSPQSSSRARVTKPSPTPQTSSAQPSPSTSSPARPPREAAYGQYKFSKLKPRERRPPPESPAGARSSHTSRPSVDETASPTSQSKRRLYDATTSPSRSRQPFFGEVVGKQDLMRPGFGIPHVDQSEQGPEGTSSQPAPSQLQTSFADDDSVRHGRTDSNVTETPTEGQSNAPPDTPISQGATSQATSQGARRRSPPSRIPVATRRRSTASTDSTTSSRSTKARPVRPTGAYNASSPVRTPRRQAGAKDSSSRRPSNASAGPTLSPVRYREYHSRGKSTKAVNNGASLTAVINAPPPPTSPRLRNSRERHLVPAASPSSQARSHDAHDGIGDVPDSEFSLANDEGPVSQSQGVEAPTEASPQSGHADHIPPPILEPRSFRDFVQTPHAVHSETGPPSQPEPLTLDTSLDVPPSEALSSTTSFEYEESPVLGMPGSFMMTPPLAQATSGSAFGQESAAEQQPSAPPEGELLQARTFQPPGKSRSKEQEFVETPQDVASELGFRESIPIMLGADDPQGWGISPTRSMESPRVHIGAHTWRAEPLDASGTISYLEEDDSPIDPFTNRGSLRPDDSASNIFYRPTMPTVPESGRMTMDSEAYSVINRVLNEYHASSEITPDMARRSQLNVQNVSPVIAQHKDWGSKEATETYLARLLSDANDALPRDDATEVAPTTAAPSVTSSSTDAAPRPSLNIPGLDDEPEEADYGGTAIIFPPESRRYSRGSRTSSNTNSWGDGSRADSSSGSLSRDTALGAAGRSHPPTYPPQPPPKDQPSARIGGRPLTVDDLHRDSFERLQARYNTQLPEIRSAGEGLGLGLQQTPPRPAYSPPPPPPGSTSIDQATAPYTPSVYAHQPPSSIVPQLPMPVADMESAYPGHGDYAHLTVDGDAGDVGDTSALAAEAARPPIPPEPPSAEVTLAGEQLTRSITRKLQQNARASRPIISAVDPDGSDGGSETRSMHNNAHVDNANGFVTTPLLNGAQDGASWADPETREADPVFQQLKKRYHVIYELIKTERVFANDMTVVGRLFYDSAVEHGVLTEQERRLLFSNAPEIATFSMKFWDALRKSIRPILQQKPRPPKANEDGKGTAQNEESDHLHDTAPPVSSMPYAWDEYEFLTASNYERITIGACISKHVKRLERLYTTYLLNHAEANKLLQSKLKAEDYKVLGWQKACMDFSKGMTQAWDLDSLLVKPVQRLLKYPLLLEQLLQLTPEEHADHADLSTARKEIIEISVRINTAKTRQETIRAIAPKDGKKGAKDLLSNRLGKGFMKNLGLKSDRVKPTHEENAVFHDEKYLFQSQRFGGHFFQIQVVLRDIEKYLEEVHQFMLQVNIMVLGFHAMLDKAFQTAYPELESQWHRQGYALIDLLNVALADHKQAVRLRVVKHILDVWKMYVRPQKLMEQRKKGLPQYIKWKQAADRNEKIDPKLQDAAEQFKIINDHLRDELPQLYDKTKMIITLCLEAFVGLQKEWWKNCQKRLLPMFEREPPYTNSMSHDMKTYSDQFRTDFTQMEVPVLRLNILNGKLSKELSTMMSPTPPTMSSSTSFDESRKSQTSRRTESISSDISAQVDARGARRSGGGYFDGRPELPGSSGSMGSSWRNVAPRSAPQSQHQAQPTPHAPERHLTGGSEYYPKPSPHSESDRSDATLTPTTSTHQPKRTFANLDGAFDDDSYMPPAMLDSAFLAPTTTSSSTSTFPQPSAPTHHHTPSSSRSSAVFSSALPMPTTDSPTSSLPPTSLPSSTDDPEPEVLFLAASLFEFNIAHDRREGGIPYLVYVPGEIFDVIGMKGELWLARNQDDEGRTVGWIWEKHFARILPDEG